MTTTATAPAKPAKPKNAHDSGPGQSEERARPSNYVGRHRRS